MVTMSDVRQNSSLPNQPNPAAIAGKNIVLETLSDIVSGAITGAAAGAAVGAAMGSAFLLDPLAGTIVGAFLGGGVNAYLKKKSGESH